MFKFTQAIRKAIILLTIIMLVSTEIINTNITALRSKHSQESLPNSHHHKHVIFDGPSEEVILKLNFKFDKDLKHFTVEQVQYSDSDAETQEEIQEVVSTTHVKTESKWINQSYIVDTANAGAQENVPGHIKREQSGNKHQEKESDSEEEDSTTTTTTSQERSPSSTNEVPISPKKSEGSSEKPTQKETHTEESAVSNGTLSYVAVPTSISSTPASVQSNSSTQTQNISNVESSQTSLIKSEKTASVSSKEDTPSKEKQNSPVSTSQSNQIPSDVPNLLIAPKKVYTLPQPKETVLAESHPQIFIAPIPERPTPTFTRGKVQKIDEKEKEDENDQLKSNQQHKEEPKEEQIENPINEQAETSMTVIALPEATISLNEVDNVGDVASQPEATNRSTIQLTDYSQSSTPTTPVVESQTIETTNTTTPVQADLIQSPAIEFTPLPNPAESSLTKEEVKQDPQIIAVSAAVTSDSNSNIEPLDSAPASSLTSELSSSSSWSLFGN